MRPILHVVVLSMLVALCVPLGCSGSRDPNEPNPWGLCDKPSDCVLSQNTCCGVCGMPSLADVDGVDKYRVSDHFRYVCPAPSPCPLCATGLNPNLLATCNDGSCNAVDVQQDVVSACVVDADCRLRVTGCCECGGSTDPSALIAINLAHEGLYEQLVCDPGSACTACAPVYPTNYEAICANSGHCAVRQKADCAAECAQQGLTCCDGKCVATYNDISNCGSCGNHCTGSLPYCDGTRCTAPPCSGNACSAGQFCCGDTCCSAGERCCAVPGPGPTGAARCATPTETGTCPVGCPLCL